MSDGIFTLMTDPDKQRPFDATVKTMIDRDPVAFLRLLGISTRGATVLNSDLSKKLAADRI
jgi:hypothetical protein